MTGKPYSVFTPYKNMWLKTINDFFLRAYPVDAYIENLAKPDSNPNFGSLMSLD
jgi:deoxyribodipyrimidine photo-lyase